MTSSDKTLVAPIAPQKDHIHEWHGTQLPDPWHWLKDPEYPVVKDEEVLNYLKAENQHFESYLSDKKQDVDSLFAELKARIKEDDASVPVQKGGFLYHWAYCAGNQYRQWFRTPVSGGEAQLILDENERAAGVESYSLHDLRVSPCERRLGWLEDNDGSERCKIYVQDLATGAMLGEPITNAARKVVWVEGGKKPSSQFLYIELNENQQPYRVRLHTIGGNAENDPIIYENDDPGFFVSVYKTQSRQWIALLRADHETCEIFIVPADQPEAEPICVAPRRQGHEYLLDHANGHFYIRTNRNHRNFEIAKAPENACGEEHWQIVLAGSDQHYFTGLSCFKDFMVVEERQNGLDQIMIVDYDGSQHRVPFDEASYCASLGAVEEFDVTTIRLSYESMVTPKSVYDYHVDSRQLTLLKQQEIPSGYTVDDYQAERLMVPVRDGALVPVSLVYKKGLKKDGQAPLHLYGYGAYGLGMPPYFSTARISLLDRGFVYAIAHIRGGDEMGRHWYEDYKGSKRTHTFHDFIDVADHLVAAGYSRIGHLSTSGGSAGGSLMGYIANDRPELWRALVAHVPFVDILNTMLDDQLPLTPMEWPEWGNPIKDVEAFQNIHSYCPYYNVQAQDYPPMLVTAGLNDPRVTYWEPAKWVAKLRDKKTDNNPLYLKTNMGSGHQGKSGRYDSLIEVAEEYVFILDQFGIAV